MPRIRDEILDCAIYLYPSAIEAGAGEKAGGSGFLVAVRSEVVPDRGYIYAVTNSHVIREGGCLVIRLNTVEGDVDILETDEDDWVHHPDGDDIAVYGIGVDDHHKCHYILKDDFVSEDIINKHGIGPGDDTFLVGRLTGHDGKQRNLPSVRFGNIAMMPWEPIEHPTRGINQVCFIVECRSVGGYSGSPVFVHIPPLASRPANLYPRDPRKPGSATFNEMNLQGYGPWLLGVDGGHLPIYQPVLESEGTRVKEGWKVESGSGMAWVVPAWRLAELLDSEELADGRRQTDEELRQRTAVEGSSTEDKVDSA